MEAEYHNPYETDPAKIPSTDQYANEPNYGRYYPQPGDFKPAPEHVNSTSLEAIAYWTSILEQCNETHRIWENNHGGRDVFAFGSVIIKSTHLQKLDGRDYELMDANEVAATALVREKCSQVRVPDIYFANKINGRSVLIQERIPGIALNVAWQYMSPLKKSFYKDQTRDIIQLLRRNVERSQSQTAPSYINPDPEPVLHRGIQPAESDILFEPIDPGTKLYFAHNDWSPSNLIVNDGEIVAVVDWEMAGFFTLEAARVVHKLFRCPQRENFAQLGLDEAAMNDLLFWDNLFAFDRHGTFSVY